MTGKKSLQVLGQLTHIVGWKKEESDYLLKFLNDLHQKSVDFQVRASYDDRTVVVWDKCVFFFSDVNCSMTHEQPYFRAHCHEGLERWVSSSVARYSALTPSTGSARRHMVRAAAHADVPSPRWPGEGQ